MSTKRINLNLTDSLHTALDTEAQCQGRPMASLVREALAQYLTTLGYEVRFDVSWGGIRDTGVSAAPHADNGGAA